MMFIINIHADITNIIIDIEYLKNWSEFVEWLILTETILSLSIE